MKTVIELLRDQIVIDDDGEKDIDIYEIDVDILPELKDGFEGMELENWEITLIEDYKMVLICGGDWEEENTKYNIEVINDRLIITSYNKTGEYEEGYSKEELLKLLK